MGMGDVQVDLWKLIIHALETLRRKWDHKDGVEENIDDNLEFDSIFHTNLTLIYMAGITQMQRLTDPVHLVQSNKSRLPEGLEQLHHHLNGFVPFGLQHHDHCLEDTGRTHT